MGAGLQPWQTPNPHDDFGKTSPHGGWRNGMGGARRVVAAYAHATRGIKRVRNLKTPCPLHRPPTCSFLSCVAGKVPFAQQKAAKTRKQTRCMGWQSISCLRHDSCVRFIPTKFGHQPWDYVAAILFSEYFETVNAIPVQPLMPSRHRLAGHPSCKPGQCDFLWPARVCLRHKGYRTDWLNDRLTD